jgi:citrate lyase subunit beta/citryl-CoA lyase
VKAVDVYPLIETPLGLAQVRDIAKTAYVKALMFGSIDFQLEMGMNGGYAELVYFRNEIVLASKLANIEAPIDGVTVDIKNDELLKLETTQAKI